MNFESPFPRDLRRQRQAFSTPSCSAIQAPDSGYGTLSQPSPSAALKEFPGFDIEAAQCLSRQGDGNQSEVDDPFADSDEENALVNQFTAALKLASDVPSRKKTKPTTLPRLTRSRSSLPQSFRTADNDIHLPRRQSDITVARQGAGSLRAPDRFIPLRSTSTDTTEKFRVGKAPHELSATEKILRHNGATEDAFCYRRRVVSPMVADTSAPPVPDSAPRRRRGMSVDTFTRSEMILTRKQQARFFPPGTTKMRMARFDKSATGRSGASVASLRVQLVVLPLTMAVASWSAPEPTHVFFGPRSRRRNQRRKKSWRSMERA